ncbi:MAG: YbhB/YbcL family Raf kinase inhibitor-like protein [Euryarchaeota archaeon]|nr:YbhB/YbcL family Raf kinase inhibitor-like protein [Euryarchaeota archaeon]
MNSETRHQDLKISIDFQYFPNKYTCKGEDISPRISIEGAERKLLAMILEDHDAPDKPYVHWLFWDLPTRSEIPENVSKVDKPQELDGAIQGSTTSGAIGYEGPCPPRGETHKYEFKVYSYDRPLNLKPGANREELLKVLESVSYEYGHTSADFSR